MNALVKKEIRLLLPSWSVAMLLALPAICTRSDDVIPVFLLFLGMAMMALTSIGRETSLNTFSSLLAQPTERTRIWKIKLSVLAAAFFTVFAVWRLATAFSFKDYGGRVADPEASASVLIAGYLVLVSTFTGGLWATLLLRQIAGAFWLMLLLPAVLAGFTTAFLADAQSSNALIAALCIIIALYAIGGFLFARWLFFRAQDVGWSGGIITLPQWRMFQAGTKPLDLSRKRQPIFALLKKEIQLQQVSLMGAAGLLVLHLGVILLRMNHQFAKNSAGEILTSIVWMLWLVLPVIIGALAVAEERRLGVMEGQLCLPVSRRVQFAIKGFLALLLGTLLGGVLPMCLEMAGKGGFLRGGANAPGSILLGIVALAAWLALVSFFASSLAKNFLQAIGYAIATFIASVMLGSALVNGRMFFRDYIPAHSFLPVVIAVPTVIVVLLWLAYLNFKNFRDGWPLWRRNLVGLAGAAVFIVATSAALYNRIWKVFEPAEPPHGPAKLSLANPPVLRTDTYNNLLVRLPDGRVWFDYLRYHWEEKDSGRMKWLWYYLVDPLPQNAGAERFMAGSDWRSATVRRVDFLLDYQAGSEKTNNHIAGYLDTVGIKTNGTLWISDASKNGGWTGDKMNRFGNETDWQQLVRMRYEVLLLKNDGTLWRWGTNRFDWGTWQTNWPSLRDYQPRQIGTGSRWKELFGNSWINLARKSDGSVWSVWQVGLNDKSRKDEFQRAINLDQVSFQALSFSGNGETAYVRPDGTLWMSWLNELNGTNLFSGFVKVGAETNWTAVACNLQRMIALKSDGSLWQWQFNRQWNNSRENAIQSDQKPPTRMGVHDDWVAIGNTWDGVIALAADGSLWLWPNREQYEQETLLKLPKQPQPLGNIFSKSN